MRAVAGHDKELRTGAVLHHAARHAQHAVGVLERVGHAVLGKFALDAVAGAAGAVALGASALNHEAGNAAVEGQPVIKTAVGQGNEVAHAFGRNIGVQFAGHDAAVLHLDGKGRIGHRKSDLSLLLCGGTAMPARDLSGRFCLAL